MRGMDMVGRTAQPLLVRDVLGRPLVLDAVVRAASAVRSCPVRYVLDATPSAQCRNLVKFAHELIQPDEALMRVPAERLWLEWFCDPGGRKVDGLGEHRMGVLVESDPSGRRGRLRWFWPRRGTIKTGWGTVIFDLND